MIVSQLRRHLIFRPVLLRSVIRPFSGLEHTFQFYDLVKNYLPEKLDNFKGLPPDTAAAKFIKLFSIKYFDIDCGNYHAMDYMVKDIHTEWKGLYQYNYENFHETGSQLLASVICCCPFEDMSRAPVMDHFIKKMGEEQGLDLIKKLPSRGYDLKTIMEILKDSPYPGFLYRCQWLFARTGNIWLDKDKYGDHFTWSKANVTKLARAWKAYQVIDKQMTEFDKWLKGQFPKHTAEVINYVASRGGKPLIDVLGADNDNKENRTN